MSSSAANTDRATAATRVLFLGTRSPAVHLLNPVQSLDPPKTSEELLQILANFKNMCDHSRHWLQNQSL
jgi:hypothetical protein